MPTLSELISQLDQLTVDIRSSADQTKSTDVAQGTAEQLEKIIEKLQGVKGDVGGTQHIYVQAFQTFLADSVANFVSISNDIGGDVQQQAALFKAAFDAQSAFIVVASESKKPAQGVLVQLLQPTSQGIVDIQEFREKRRSSEFFNHLSAVSEAMPALGWVTIEPKPGPFVKEMGDAGQFYSNRVLKDFKGKDVKHVNWVNALTKVFKDLGEYVTKHHTTGLIWNKQGKDAVPSAAPPPAAPSGGVAPPPPPPPAVQAPTVTDSPGGGDDSARGALFAEINKGGDITKGLKKVSKDMQTHKNPALRQGPKPFGAPKPFKPASVSKPSAGSAAQVKKPPKLELQAKKWVVEYFEDNPMVEVNVPQMKQTVYIYKCTNSTIQVKGKVNSITLDGCKKVGLLLENSLSGVDIVNCQSVKVQMTERVPTVNIDKTDGAMIYLSTASLDAQFVTAKSSEMNILIPEENGEFKEFAVPEQFRTVYDAAKKKLQTECAEVVG